MVGRINYAGIFVFSFPHGYSIQFQVHKLVEMKLETIVAIDFFICSLFYRDDFQLTALP